MAARETMTKQHTVVKPQLRTAFTLVELLVVITIIGILVALLLPAVQTARESARRLQCANNFKQVGLALHGYHASHGSFPPGTTNYRGSTGTWNKQGWSWAVFILPYLEQSNLYNAIDLNERGWIGLATMHPNYTSPANRAVMERAIVPTYNCPSSPCPMLAAGNNSSQLQVQVGAMVGIAGAVPTSYTDPRHDAGPAADAHAWNGVLFALSRVSTAHIRDGTTNVVMVGETSDWGTLDTDPTKQFDCRGMYHAGFWMGSQRQTISQKFVDDPRVFNTTVIHERPLGTKVCSRGFNGGVAAGGSNFDNQLPIQSAHPGGAHLLFCDGSVQFLSQSIEFELFKHLAIRDSGQVKSWQ